MDNKLEQFFDNYSQIINDVDYKLTFFKNLSDKAYLEMTRLLPKVNVSLKAIGRKIDETVSPLKIGSIPEKSVKEVLVLADEFRVIPGVILGIMTSLQVQDAVEQCIEHIIKTLNFTEELIDSTKAKEPDDETYRVIKYLKMMPELLSAQLDHIYTRMDDSLCFLPKQFHNIFEILRPTISMEDLLEGKAEMNKMEIIIERLAELKNATESTDEIDVLIDTATDEIRELEKEIPEVTNMLDLSSAAPRTLQQPLTEILLLTSKIDAASIAADSLLLKMYEGEVDDINCNELLTKVVAHFSTKGEIDIARELFGDLEIEESGEEGELELF